MDADPQEQLERLRKKYYDSLEELERKEENWSQLETRLYRNLSRLALAVYGSVPNVDERLDAVRNAIRARKDCGLIASLIERVHDAASEFEAAKQRAAKEAPTPSAAVRRFLRGLEFPGGSPPRVAEFERRASEVESTDDLNALLDDIARFCSSALEAPEENRPPSGPDGVDEAARLLLDLLERLSLPDDLEHQLLPAKARLTTGVTREHLGGVIETTVATITEMRARLQMERAALQDLLLGVTERLGEIEQFLLGADASRVASRDSRRELRVTFSAQVRDFQSEATAVQDIDLLKQVLNQSLTTLEQRMEGFLQTEEAQSQALEREIQELSSSLGETQAETERLREELERQTREARLDGLTGIANRGAYDLRVGEEHARWRRYRTPLTLMVWDIDRFKSINDAYGHQAGDKVIRSLAALLQTRIRDTDFLARYGGEEFVVLMPETTREDAFRVAEALRAAVASARFHYHETPVAVTASCGIAEFAGDDTPESVFRRADDALYAAKTEGRNRVQVDPTPHRLRAIGE